MFSFVTVLEIVPIPILVCHDFDRCVRRSRLGVGGLGCLDVCVVFVSTRKCRVDGDDTWFV